jgi:enoyl-CoA hydratase/carnithine racemase
VGTVFLGVPPENYISRTLVAGLREAVIELDRDESVRSVVVVGSGPANFSEGLDLEEWSSLSTREAIDSLQAAFEALWALEHMTKPSVAAIEGSCRGAGAEVALACDVRVGSETVQMSFPQVDSAWMPSHGGTARLSRIVGRAKALDILLSARVLSAAELYELGVVESVTPAAGALPRATWLARTFATKPRGSVRAIKRALTEGDEKPYRNRFLLEAQHSAQLIASEDYRAALSRRGKGPGRS